MLPVGDGAQNFGDSSGSVNNQGNEIQVVSLVLRFAMHFPELQASNRITAICSARDASGGCKNKSNWIMFELS